MLRNLFLSTLFTLFISTCQSQWTSVSGTVYDITKRNPVEAVSVVSTSGRGTMTDSVGKYTLIVKETDSIYFSFLNKETIKFAIKTIPNLAAFDISILKKIGELPIVFVKQRNYKQDSLQNRLDYAKIFNYEKPGIKTSMNDMGVGMDLDSFIKMFQFRRNKRMASFQRRLFKEEEDRYINHRFNKGLVKRLTGLNTPEIDSFMNEFKPTLIMVQLLNDLELGQYVVEAFKYYKAGIKVNRSLFDIPFELYRQQTLPQ